MNQVVTITRDGSFTILNTENGTTFHSIHGAQKESLHVYIQTGLDYFNELYQPLAVSVLEMGLGTALNVYLTAEWAEQKNVKVRYHSLEKFPLSPSLAESFGEYSGFTDLYTSIHQAPWNEWIEITPWLSLFKQNADIATVELKERYEVVFYDAFAPTAQPELWTEEIFRKIRSAMTPGTVLVTYCSKGNVKRALKAAGFTVKKVQGPPGKREILRVYY